MIEKDSDKLLSTLVKDHSACVDFLDTILDACIVATITTFLFPTNHSIDKLQRDIGTTTHNFAGDSVVRLREIVTNYKFVSTMRQAPNERRNIELENMILFMQQALLLRVFHRAMRQGDSGRVVCCLPYFTSWFQDSKQYNYASETLRLMACLRRV